MKRQYGCVLFILSGTAALAIMCVIAYYGFRLSECSTDIFRRSPSPDGQNVVLLLHRDCGATTPYNTQAVLFPAHRYFVPIDYTPFFVVKQLHDLEVRWLSNNQIEVAIPSGDEIYRQDIKVGDVRIRYKYR